MATAHPLLTVPPPLAKLFSYFPLKTYPPSKPAKRPIVDPLLWVHPPFPSVPGKESVLSADVECLKWQAHIALRGFRNVSVRWDVSQDGALNGRLPNLQSPSERTKDPDGELIAAQDIPTWIDEKVGALDDLEGYKDVHSRDESHAWIALLEGDVHAALVSLLQRILSSFLSFMDNTVYYRRWPNPCHPSFIIQSSSYPLPPPNGPSNPSSRRHRPRFLASRLLYPLTVRVFHQTPSAHDTVMQSPRSPSAWANMNGFSDHRTYY
jgi:hypothetical protein